METTVNSDSPYLNFLAVMNEQMEREVLEEAAAWIDFSEKKGKRLELIMEEFESLGDHLKALLRERMEKEDKQLEVTELYELGKGLLKLEMLKREVDHLTRFPF